MYQRGKNYSIILIIGIWGYKFDTLKNFFFCEFFIFLDSKKKTEKYTNFFRKEKQGEVGIINISLIYILKEHLNNF